MCGIVAVVGRPGGRAAPSATELLAGLDAAAATLAAGRSTAELLGRGRRPAVAVADRAAAGRRRASSPWPADADLDAAVSARLDGLDAASRDASRPSSRPSTDDEPADGVEARQRRRWSRPR